MAKEQYDHKKVEEDSRALWSQLDLYNTDLSNTEKDPYYLLVEFPYPSGDLHTGHWYAYAMPDIYARYLRMKGKNVLFPFGFDAFGLPAENAAIKRGLDPKEWTYANMDTMRTQVKNMGVSFDWDKEVITCDPEYYKWTQWLFSKLYEHKLAERREAAVKWCPKDQTVLANEQVLNGHCERCGTEVEEKFLTQWFLKITQYAKRLLTDLDPLPWREEIKEAQRAWIGESEGAKISFPLKNIALEDLEVFVEVFTTRPETIFGVTYIVLAPEHPLLPTLMPAVLNTEEVEAYKLATTKKTERERSENKEKTGVKLEGVFAYNPATLDVVPVYVADYVLASYGTGAVMAVPAHDERDFEFATRQNQLSAQTQQHHLIFDFDGVLGDTFEKVLLAQVAMGNVPDIETARNHVLNYASKKPHHARDHSLTPEELQYNYDWTDKFGEILHANGIELFTEFVDEIIKIPNAKIAVVTSGSVKYVGPAIENSKLNPSHVLTFEDHHSKEEKVERIARDWGVNLNEISYFTDTKADYYELETILDQKKIFGCAWGFLGADVLEEVMPRSQILENYSDIHTVVKSLESNKSAGTMLSIKQVVVPCSVDQINPPQDGLEDVKRDTVVVHLRDKSTGKFALLNWHGTLEGITTAIMGGIEEGQTPEEAALAEIHEEAGLEGVQIIHTAPWVTAAKYCASHKGQNRTAHAYGFIAEVENLSNQKETTEYEQKTHTLTWVDESEVLSSLTPAHQKQIWEILHSENALTTDGYLINSGEFDGRDSQEAMSDILDSTGAERVTQYRIRDWLISRQRYWGCPIPVVYDPEGNPHLVPAEHLPWTLPTDVDFSPTGKSPLATSKELHERVERIFGKGWTPEYDTLDVFVDSSWYYARYLDSKNQTDFSNQAVMKQWLPVDRYTGGAEHTTVHLLYSRFFYKALYDMALVPTPEPFIERFNRGIILGPDGQKMSKSKGNVVNPDALVQEFGADAVRMYLAFIGPYNEPGSYPWNLGGVESMRKFLDRIYRLSNKVTDSSTTDEFTLALGKAAAKIGGDIEKFKFNTAIAALMILVRDLESFTEIPRTTYRELLLLLAPFAPHLSESLWHVSGGTEQSIHSTVWPHQDMSFTEELATIIIQINSKKKGEITIEREATEETVLGLAREIEAVNNVLGSDSSARVIYVPGRILNIVTSVSSTSNCTTPLI